MKHCIFPRSEWSTSDFFSFLIKQFSLLPTLGTKRELKNDLHVFIYSTVDTSASPSGATVSVPYEADNGPVTDGSRAVRFPLLTLIELHRCMCCYFKVMLAGLHTHTHTLADDLAGTR